VYALLKDGVPVTYRDVEGIERFERVQVIDWNMPGNNDFFLASQLWVSGEILQAPGRLGGVCQWPATGLHRAEGGPQGAEKCL